MNLKKNILIYSSLLFTVLSGCGTQINASEPLFAEVQDTITAKNDITLKSDEGLYDFITKIQRALFKAYDKNNDGFVTKPEVNEFMQSEFSEIDLDHNGKITFKESTKSIFFFERVMSGGLFRGLMNKLFIDYLDNDGNMYLSREEFLGFYLKNATDPSVIRYFKTSFTKNDINKDNLLNFSEYEDAMYQMFKRDIRVEIRDNGYTIIFG